MGIIKLDKYMALNILLLHYNVECGNYIFPMQRRLHIASRTVQFTKKHISFYCDLIKRPSVNYNIWGLHIELQGYCGFT